MKISVPKEIKVRENRAALTPAGASALIAAGHVVHVQADAGIGSGFSNEDYAVAGAELVTAEQAWDGELILKVKEPQEHEYVFLTGQIVFTYFHLAGVAPSLTEALLSSGTTAVAYETVEDQHGKLPLLAPMSAVAGNMAVSMGNYYLAKFNDGKGTLLGTVLGKRQGKVVIIGDGVVGRHAARAADGMGTDVCLIGRHPQRAAELAREISANVRYVESEADTIAHELQDADLLIGGVLLRGARAPHVVSKQMVQNMQPGSVIVDVSIDQGGCVETARPTSHAEPVYSIHDVTHYCVTNMPGAYPRTSTIALTEATLPYALRLARDGIEALRADHDFGKGVNTHAGFVTCKAVADALSIPDRYQMF